MAATLSCYLGWVGRGDAVGEGVGAEVAVGHFAAGVLRVLDQYAASGHTGHTGTPATARSPLVSSLQDAIYTSGMPINDSLYPVYQRFPQRCLQKQQTRELTSARKKERKTEREKERKKERKKERMNE